MVFKAIDGPTSGTAGRSTQALGKFEGEVEMEAEGTLLDALLHLCLFAGCVTGGCCPFRILEVVSPRANLKVGESGGGCM